MKKPAILLLMIFTLGFFPGCYPEGPEFAEELDIAYTVYDDEYDFASKGTYALPDRIPRITGDLIDGEEPEFIKEPYNSNILSTIASNMADLGWTQVEDPEDADIQLLPAAWTNTTVVFSGSYWCWYYPYYCGGWWYYPYPAATSYSTGTLVMVMNDLNAESTDGSTRIVWTAAINGLLTGTYNADRVNNGINQSFEQSPYLQTN
jgi:hypothetical protein